MNIFDKLFKDESDKLLEQIYGGNSTTAGSTQAVGAAGQAGSTLGTTAGGLQQQLGAAGQAMFGGVLTQQQISQMLQNYAIGLSPEEQKELEQLQTEYAAEIKACKLAIFKKLPTELRQFVVNALSWRECTQEINGVIIDKSERLKELENKNSYKHMFGGPSVGPSYGMPINNNWYGAPVDASMADSLSRFISIPDGITAEELKQAHVEATLEEEILNGKKED